MGRCVCCVPFCKNSAKNSTCSFHAFPSAVKRPDQRIKWINAVKLQYSDGTEWTPTRSDTICSKHFVGHKKSFAPNSPAYIPTIFPKQYKCKAVNFEQVLSRYNRYLNRSQLQSSMNNSKKGDLCSEVDVKSIASSTNEEALVIHSTSVSELRCDESVICDLSAQKDKTCQVTIIDENDSFQNIIKETFSCNVYVFSNSSKCDAAIQTEITLPRKTKIVCNSCSTKNFKNKKCGTSRKTFNDTAVGTDVHDIPKQKNRSFSGFVSIEDEQELLDFAGVSYENFNLLLRRMKDSKNFQISKEDRLLIFLVKLKTGLTFSAMKTIFRAHRATISRIFYSTLEQLVSATKDFVYWPSKDAVQATMPKCFKPEYQDTRAVIDCTEFRIEVPKGIDNRVWCYSHYKKGFTCKVLIAITPSGFISFKSKAAGGRKSDSQLTTESKLIDYLEKGDVILADKGFPEFRTIIENSGKEAIVIMPPFLEKNQHFTEEQCEETYSIAKVRIHVERIMQRLRTYRILDKIPEYLFKHIDSVIHICCVLVNLQPPIIAEVSSTM